MKKIISALCLLCGFALNSFAQSDIKYDNNASIGFESGMTLGGASASYRFVIGASLKFDIPRSQSCRSNHFGRIYLI
jgi:hypothetical protein